MLNRDLDANAVSRAVVEKRAELRERRLARDTERARQTGFVSRFLAREERRQIPRKANEATSVEVTTQPEAPMSTQESSRRGGGKSGAGGETGEWKTFRVCENGQAKEYDFLTQPV